MLQNISQIPLPPSGPEIPEPPTFPDLAPPTPPEVYLESNFFQDNWLLISIIALVLIIAIITVFLIIRNQKSKEQKPSAAQIAIAELEMLSNSHLSIRELAIQISFIFRRFLSGETNDPALYETQQEFNRRPSALTALSPEKQLSTRNILDQLSSLKYEPNTQENTELINELLASSIQLIKEIDVEVQQEIEETDLFSKSPKS